MFRKVSVGLALQFLAVFPLAAQVDVNPLPADGQPGRVVYKEANELGRAALMAVAKGDYAGLKRMTAFGMTRRDWQALGNEFKAKAVARLKADKDAPADEVKRMLQRMEEQFNVEKLDEAMKRTQRKEKRYQDAFKKMRQEGKALGIDWERIIFKEVDRTRIRKGEPAGMEEGDLFAIFFAGKKVYHLELDHCLNTSRLGWLIGPGSLQLRAGMPADFRGDDPADAKGKKGPPKEFKKGEGPEKSQPNLKLNSPKKDDPKDFKKAPAKPRRKF